MKDNNQAIIDDILTNDKRNNDRGINQSIILYRLIRELYDRNKDILNNHEFIWAYSAYYGLSSHYKKDDLARYFSVMEKHIKENGAMSINEVVNELQTEKKHYSFASKLMNFVCDEEYPIIDGNIIKVFHFKVRETAPSRYDTITQVYNDLLQNKKFTDYLNKFNFSGIGKMKQIDIIIWNMAKTL